MRTKVKWQFEALLSMKLFSKKKYKVTVEVFLTGPYILQEYCLDLSGPPCSTCFFSFFKTKITTIKRLFKDLAKKGLR